jgi:arginyl-tRNA synthetase
MMTTVHDVVRKRLQDVLLELYALDQKKLPELVIEYPPNSKLGDLAITVAFELARTLRKAPRIIAQEIVLAFGSVEGIDRIEAASNGYINIYLNRSVYFRSIIENKNKPIRKLNDEKIIVEHTAINPNKAAHVGHLRNAALGDTLVRLLQFKGIPVETQNYIDDTGVQIADVTVGFKEIEQKTLDDVKEIAASSRFDYYCWDLYARVTNWYDGDAKRLHHRSKALLDLEQGENDTSEMAQFIAKQIVQCHLSTMARLNVEYDLLSWEGDILRLDFWKKAFSILKSAKAIFLETEGKQAGCWVMPIENESTTEPPDDEDKSSKEKSEDESRNKVIVRSDGTVTYIGKDIAYQFWKFGLLGKNFHFRFYAKQNSGRSLWATSSEIEKHSTHHAQQKLNFGHATAVYNVIDTRQSYLQKLLKQSLTAMNKLNEANRSIHFSYEMVTLSHDTARELGYEVAEGGKSFVEVSGRKGLGVKADDLLDRITASARQEARSRNPELAESEIDKTATIIATAAVRYFMIKYSRGKIITFDINEALNFEGESGPYLQYSAVRAANILKKLKDYDGTDDLAINEALPTLSVTPLNDSTSTDLWELVLNASRLDEVVTQAVRTLELGVLAKYTFSLAQNFNAFYHRYPVIQEENRDVRIWRAAAVSYFRRQLTSALDLMGCEAPQRM